MRFWPFSRTEKKSLAAPTDEELLIFTGGAAVEGLISRADALTVSAVNRAIVLISVSIASFDVLVEKRQGNQWHRDDGHDVAKLLSAGPNDWSSTHELLRDLIATALTVDKGGIAHVGRADGGRVVEVIRYEPAHTTVDYSTDGRLEPSFRINNTPVPASDIIHLRGPLSRCPLSLSIESATLLKKLETQALNLMRRGGRPGGVLSTSKSVGDSGVKKMLAGWSAAHEGADNSGRTAILYDGATWQAMSLNAVDQQFIETWKFAIIEVARHFGVPPQALYDWDRATWANSEQAAKEWLASLELWMKPLEAAARRALFTDEERPDYRIRFDRDDFTAVDLTARATAISSLISSRVLNPNEGRDWLGMPPRDGGEEFANPNTGASQPGPAENQAAPAQKEPAHAA